MTIAQVYDRIFHMSMYRFLSQVDVQATVPITRGDFRKCLQTPEQSQRGLKVSSPDACSGKDSLRCLGHERAQSTDQRVH